ncbi:hypothetical protein EOM39_04320 [Candidatus Gracilibacteria bacterium]|nr:hypothetical protein [Candidatus Gracilibacteria bacterium]
MVSKPKSISDKDVERKIQDMFGIDISGIPIKDLKRYLNEGITEDRLNKYRTALAYSIGVIAVREDIKEKVIVSIDGRDAAGKGSNISRVTKDLDIKKYGVKAFNKPTKEERYENEWFNRYKHFFPDLNRDDFFIRFFDRSWYNRSGVEAAMGFCSIEEYNYFMDNVIPFELREIYKKEFKHIKVYLSVTKEIQKERLDRRNKLIRKRWKSSPIDKVAPEKRNDYTLAKFLTLSRTDHENSPWIVLDSNYKFLSSIEIMKAIIATNDRLLEIVQNDLDINLSPNSKIRRTAHEELILMRNSGDLDKAAKKRGLDIDDVLNPDNIDRVFDFRQEGEESGKKKKVKKSKKEVKK